MTERSAGLPSPERVIELLSDEFARAGYEIEDVSIAATTRPPRIRVIADGERPLDLEAVAALSRSASEVLDADRLPARRPTTSRSARRAWTGR